MTGLVLKLAPNERVMINGVVMENGDRKTTLKIKTPQAAILRLRDALHPDDAKTPVRRAYYLAQLAVAGTLEVEAAAEQLTPRLADLAHAFAPTDAHSATVAVAQNHLRKRNLYAVMRTLHPLIEVERQLLAAGVVSAALGRADTVDATLFPQAAADGVRREAGAT